MITRNCFKYLLRIIQLPDDIMIGSLLCLAARADDEELTGSVSEHLLATAQCTSDCSCSVWVLQVRLSALYIVLLRIEMDEPTYNQSNM